MSLMVEVVKQARALKEEVKSGRVRLEEGTILNRLVHFIDYMLKLND